MKKESIEFEVGQETLRGNLYLAKNPKKPAVLFLHGWTGLPQDTGASVLAKNGYNTMTFSLSGHNNSSGKLEDQTIQKSLQEVIAGYDFFKNKLGSGTKIGAAGNSYGGYMSILLSEERPVCCMSLRVAANYIDDDFTVKRMGRGSENPDVFKWRHLNLKADATRALRALHSFGGPIQIIEAGLDEMVPHESTQNYVDAASDKTKLDYHLMEDWPHSLGLDAERNRTYQKILLDWLNKISEQI